jgi:hypothetical protein
VEISWGDALHEHPFLHIDILAVIPVLE